MNEKFYKFFKKEKDGNYYFRINYKITQPPTDPPWIDGDILDLLKDINEYLKNKSKEIDEILCEK